MRLIRVILMMLLVCATQIQARVYLVSVGIADYPGKVNDLSISDNDAKVIAKVFEATNNSYAIILVNEEATIESLLRNMQTAFSDAKEEDEVILYFSGHGTPGALVCYDGLLTYQRIYNVMKNCFYLLALTKHRRNQDTRIVSLPSF